MLAAYASSIDPDDPLHGLEIDERPDPEVPPGWSTITVKAASLNHHDLWSLRGVGLSRDQLPMIRASRIASGTMTNGSALPP